MEQSGEENYQGFSHGNGNTIYGDAMRGKNSNIARRCRFEWQGVECDLVNNGGVFIAKKWVVACDPHETIFDDELGEDHILYCPKIVSMVMTIWKWMLVQMILDGYSLKEHLIA